MLFSIAVLLLVVGVKSFLYLGEFLVHCLQFGNELCEELGYSFKEVEFCLCHILISFADTKVSKKIDITKFFLHEKTKKIPCISARDFSPFPPLVWLLSLSHCQLSSVRESNLALGFSLSPLVLLVQLAFPWFGIPLSQFVPLVGVVSLSHYKDRNNIFNFQIFFTFFHYATHTIL